MPLAEREFLAYARGRKPADLLLADARVVNVYSARVVRTSVAVAGGVIVGLGDYRARRRVNLRGLYLAPGFIDGHIHIESTTLSPDQFARAALPRGTTAVVADPHEVANVAGARGVRFMLASSRNAPLSIFVMLPSCVPASPLEAAGAALGAEELRGLLGERGVLGVGEMMNYPGVLAGDADMVAKLRLGRGRGAPVDGHCPGLSGRDLQAYAGVGIGSDHESTRAEEAREKLEAGLYVMVREGSVARNLATLARIIRAESARRFLLVSDDLSPDDLIRSGHMDHIVREAIRLGVPPLWALQMVSLNPAEYFGLHDRGAVAPGKRADLVTFERLNRPYIRDVFVEGEPVARDGRLLRPWAAPKVRGGVGRLRVPPSALERLAVPAKGRRIRAIRAFPDQIVTGTEILEARVEGGQAVPDPGRDILKLSLFERHRGTGNVGVGFVRGFGLRRGALASTVAHDAHNLIAVGASDAAIRTAAEAAIRMGGGMVAVRGKRVLADLPLPLWGLMSERPAAEVAARKRALDRAARALGSSLPDPFLTLSFLALSVIPTLKISDRGLVDVTRFQRVPLFVR